MSPRTRSGLLALAEATEQEALARGADVARLRLIQQTEEEARMLGHLARGVREGKVDATSATAEGLEALARGLRLLGGASGAELARDLHPHRRAWWERVRGAWRALVG